MDDIDKLKERWPGFEAQSWKQRFRSLDKQYRDLSAQSIERAVSQAQTITDLQAEVAGLKEALTTLYHLEHPRPIGEHYNPNKETKHDKCIHGAVMYESCDNCVSDYSRKALGAKE